MTIGSVSGNGSVPAQWQARQQQSPGATADTEAAPSPPAQGPAGPASGTLASDLTSFLVSLQSADGPADDEGGEPDDGNIVTAAAANDSPPSQGAVLSQILDAIKSYSSQASQTTGTRGSLTA